MEHNIMDPGDAWKHVMVVFSRTFPEARLMAANAAGTLTAQSVMQ